MPGNSITLHRVLKAAPEKVYRAFTEANAIASWIPPWGFVCVVHSMDVKVGGEYKMSFTNFSTGNGHSFRGRYLELKPGEFIKYSDKFDNPNMPGEMTTSIWLKQVSCALSLKSSRKTFPQPYQLKCVIWDGKNH